MLRFAVERLAAGLRAVAERLAAAPDVFARPVPDLLAVVLLAVERFAVERLAGERFAEVLRAPLLRAPEADEPPLEPALALPSIVHLPDITRCAASATASAIREPSLVALDMTLLAARSAVSAASSPASRIFLRAAGLALIAAAAAARPAANISLLIAALASLSTVLSLDFELREEEPEELLRADFAIASSPSVAGKTLQGRNGSRKWRMGGGKGSHFAKATSGRSDMLKGTAADRCGALRHGQRPEVTAVRQRSELTNTPFRPPC
ncbi:MAG TPA: hypothetical protein VM308_00385 [Sphingomicrobium sp.]|nr:hypothetical protein [Sphingomicrobium sp.]